MAPAIVWGPKAACRNGGQRRFTALGMVESHGRNFGFDKPGNAVDANTVRCPEAPVFAQDP